MSRTRQGRKHLLAIFAFLLGMARLAATTADDLAARVVILANSSLPESVELARYYAAQRGVPAGNIVALPMPSGEDIGWRAFLDTVYTPVQAELHRRGWLEGTASSLVDRLGRRRYAFVGHRISYLVVCRGVPLRIPDDPDFRTAALPVPAPVNRSDAAVDSELSLLAMSGYQLAGYLPNPLYHRDGILMPDAAQIVKVSRLDGPTWESARHLVDSALAAERTGLIGRYYIDLKGPHEDGDEWLQAARARLDSMGFDGDTEDSLATFGPAARFDAPALYFGWYTGSLDGPFRAPGFVFPDGAIALHIHSFSAETLHSTTRGWCGPLVARGVAATMGNVFEPYLQLTHNPGLLVSALSRGWNLGDAAYYALPALSWQAITLGDPLYRPFRVSLPDQLALRDRLPPGQARYVTVRDALREARQGRAKSGIARLRDAQGGDPDLIVGLALSRLLLEQGDRAGAAEALAFVRARADFSPEDWPLARFAAQALLAAGDATGAARVCQVLAGIEAPVPEARVELLAEGEAAATAAGDELLALEFARRRAAEEPPPASGP